MFKPAIKTYELSLVKTYVAHWGMAEAVRELLQNALDSNSPFVYEFIHQDCDVPTISLKLNSEFSSLSPSTLLLGATSKAEEAGAIGSFGEGYKIALLVLTRLGFDVDIFNNGKLWKPRFKFNQKYEQELLCIEETDHPYQVDTGLTFYVHGLNEDHVEAIRASCLKMQNNIGERKVTTMGEILLERPGELYVGGLLICKTDLQFGYNILPSHITLERDRQTVAHWSLRSVTKNMWFETKDYKRIAELIEADTPDLQYAEYGCPELVKEACYQLFRSRNPGKVIAKNNEEMEKLVARGLTVYIGGSTYYHSVSTSPSYQTEHRTAYINQSPSEILAAWLKANRSEMRSKAIEAFKKDLLEPSAKWKV